MPLRPTSPRSAADDPSADGRLRDDVRAELDWDPSIDASGIGVGVEGGVVTLSGHVRTGTQKAAAADAAMRVRGVRAVAQEIEVRPPERPSASDDDIARRALEVVTCDLDLPGGWIKVVVDAGHVTLTGEVDWHFQREAAEEAIRRIGGVTGTTNHILLRRKPKADDLQQRIEAALTRSAEIEARAVRVTVFNDHVVLDGRVRSPSARKVLERAVWAAPGVRSVDDRVEIGEVTPTDDPA